MLSAHFADVSHDRFDAFVPQNHFISRHAAPAVGDGVDQLGVGLFPHVRRRQILHPLFFPDVGLRFAIETVAAPAADPVDGFTAFGALLCLAVQHSGCQHREGQVPKSHVRKRARRLPWRNLPEGTLYPALLRLDQRGWIRSRWGTSDANRRARYYEITRKGRQQVEKKPAEWSRTVAIIGRFAVIGTS